MATETWEEYYRREEPGLSEELIAELAAGHDTPGPPAEPEPEATQQGGDAADPNNVFSDAELSHIDTDFQKLQACVARAYAHFPDITGTVQPEHRMFSTDKLNQVKAHMDDAELCIARLRQQLP